MIVGPMATSPDEHLALADWRRRVAELYANLRADERAPEMRAVAFRAARDRLFGEHPSSPVPEAARHDFRGVAYFRHAVSPRACAHVSSPILTRSRRSTSRARVRASGWRSTASAG